MVASKCIFYVGKFQTSLKLTGMLAAAHSVEMRKQVRLLFFDWWLKRSEISSKYKTCKVIWIHL